MDTIERLAKSLGADIEMVYTNREREEPGIVLTDYDCYLNPLNNWELAGRLIEEYRLRLISREDGAWWSAGSDIHMIEYGDIKWHKTPIIAVYEAVIAIKEGDSDE